jgi:uncharacterized protein (TIGR03437 family)
MVVAGILIALCSQAGYGQGSSSVILAVDVENLVNYVGDTADPSRFATNPNVTPAVVPRNFHAVVVLGDIVAVNGEPAKGIFAFISRVLTLTTAPNPGQAIADLVRANANEQTFEILKIDGTPIGSIMASGLGGGSALPGGPLAVTTGNNAIVGGTGAFLGARGQVGQSVTPQTIANRVASVTEDPANRRRNGGGRTRFFLQVIPLFRPEVILTLGFPTVTHSNGVLTEAQPARPGEVLSLFATGLGPTRPGVNPGEPFTDSPRQIVNSPVAVIVNGQPAEILSAIGLPGAVDTYRIDFRLPSGLGGNLATIQVIAGFIPGSEVKIPVR